MQEKWPKITADSLLIRLILQSRHKKSAALEKQGLPILSSLFPLAVAKDKQFRSEDTAPVILITRMYGGDRRSYTPYTNMPAAADITIKRMGDNFFFAKCLYANIVTTKSAVMMSACTFTLNA